MFRVRANNYSLNASIIEVKKLATAPILSPRVLPQARRQALKI